ncbi:hypothetical protein HMPREF9445_00218 [Bacteroides clarus YIT 12056]|uniref:Uncharacterized protein n=1 Tax=Bacteroides clarus YIT 12056 TaxID=762984 RepID=A0ABP2KWR7_9BACE|nr:hypothetical protein HMPREF9445_00218 [Bacteroides clarus YIT 12056]
MTLYSSFGWIWGKGRCAGYGVVTGLQCGVRAVLPLLPVCFAVTVFRNFNPVYCFLSLF